MSERALPAREAYALWAERYDAENAVTEMEQRAVATLSPPLAGARLLDAACGTGRRIAPARETSLSVGIDLVPAMLQQGPPGLRLAAGDVRALPCRDAQFDVVWCRLALGHVPELRTAYAEFGRVLRAGGSLIVTDFHPAAARAGHRRTFRARNQVEQEIEHFVHDVADHASAAQGAGLHLGRSLELAVGPEVRAHYLAAGHEAAYREQLGLPLVLALAFHA